MPYDGFYRIEEGGTYYLNVTTEETDETKLEMTFYSYPEDQVGTLDNPILANDVLTGTVGMTYSQYFYLLQDSPQSGSVVLSLDEGDFGWVWVTDGFTNKMLWTSDRVGFLVEEGQDVIVIITTDYETFDYTICWEFLEIPNLITDIALMPENTIGSRMILAIGEPDYSQSFKFTITEEGEYSLFPFVDEYLQIEFEFISQLYDYQGNLLTEYEHDVEWHLTPGTYYIVVTGNGSESFVLNYVISKIIG